MLTHGRPRIADALQPTEPDGRRPYNWAVAAPGPSTVPARIHADRAGRSLAIEWADGHASTYDFAALRWLCPCAFCRGEAGLPGWLDTRPTLTAEQTSLVDIHLVGQYAVAPEWGDGHHTGYYTFGLLRDRCTCDECHARRVRQANESNASSSGTGASRTGHAGHAPTAGEPATTVTTMSKESGQ